MTDLKFQQGDRVYSTETYNSDNISLSQWEELKEFIRVQKLASPNDPAIENMLETTENGLLFNIKHKIRWTTDLGDICILKYNNIIIGVSAVERTLLHSHLSIGGVRCWLDINHRNNQLVTKYLLDSNLRWSKNNDMWSMMLTFNSYNKTIYDGIKRKSLKKSVGVGNIWSSWWNDCILFDKPINIRYTEQWCVLKPINEFGNKIIKFELQRIK